MNKTVLLIGASGGLGKHITLGLANAGYDLALHYHNNQSNLQMTLDELKNLTSTVRTYSADITSEAEVQDMIGKVIVDFGSIDVLINNSGISINGMSWKLSLEDWNKVLAVNLTGPFLCTKHVLPIMREKKKGRIIYMSSVVAQTGVPGTASYAATKAGLSGLCKTVSKEIIKSGITANLISLGYFDAGMLYQIPEDMRSKIKESIPKNEFGNPGDLVECILYLCNDNSGYLTGQSINLNGGLF